MVDRTSLSREAAETVFDNLGGRESLGLDNQLEDQQLDQGDQQDDQQLDQQDDQGDQFDDLSDDTSGHLPRGAEVKPDKEGNLRSPDGKIVAAKGADARRYMDLHNTRGRLTQTTAQVTDLTQKLTKAVEIGREYHRRFTALEAQNAAVKQFGLEPEQHLRALELFKSLQSDPEKTLKTLLTRAAANGINLTNLGLQGGGVDAKALVDLVREEIEKKMKPLQERTDIENRQSQERQQADESTRRAKEEVDNFFNAPENQDAKNYLPVFNSVLQNPQFAKMSLGEIWARIQLQLIKNPPKPGRRSGQNSRSGARSIPAGRGAPQNGSDDELAPVSKSYGEILGEVFDKAGIR